VPQVTTASSLPHLVRSHGRPHLFLTAPKPPLARVRLSTEASHPHGPRCRRPTSSNATGATLAIPSALPKPSVLELPRRLRSPLLAPPGGGLPCRGLPHLPRGLSSSLRTSPSRSSLRPSRPPPRPGSPPALSRLSPRSRHASSAPAPASHPTTTPSSRHSRLGPTGRARS
jgi:hypothetical protein